MTATRPHTRALHGAQRVAKPLLSAVKRGQRLELRRRQLDEARTDLASLLPVEGEKARKVIEQRIEALENALRDPTFEERYQRLSMDVLGWRDKNGFPKLVPFSLDSPTFSIAGYWGLSELGDKLGEPSLIDCFIGDSAVALERENTFKLGGSASRLPFPMMEMYNDILERFRQEFEGHVRRHHRYQWSKTITAMFSGVIPQHVRELIKVSSPDFATPVIKRDIKRKGWTLRKRIVESTEESTPIFLLAEVAKWRVDEVVVQQRDPLIVGYKAGSLWLIGSFDETPLENYAWREFCTKE